MRFASAAAAAIVARGGNAARIVVSNCWNAFGLSVDKRLEYCALPAEHTRDTLLTPTRT